MVGYVSAVAGYNMGIVDLLRMSTDMSASLSEDVSYAVEASLCRYQCARTGPYVADYPVTSYSVSAWFFLSMRLGPIDRYVSGIHTVSKCLHQFLQLAVLFIHRPGGSLKVRSRLLKIEAVSTPTCLETLDLPL